MKKIIISAFLLCWLFVEKSKCQNLVFANQIQPSVEIGTTDTFASISFVADTCGATLNALTFTRTLTAPDAGFSNVQLHLDGVAVGLVPFASGVTTFMPYTIVVLPGDTLKIDIIGNTATDTSLIGKTIAFNIGIQLLNCFNDPLYLTINGPSVSISGCVLSFGKNSSISNQTITPGVQKLIGSFSVKPFGCSFTSSYVVINNTGTTQSSAIHNVLIKKNNATQVGSPLPVLGQNSVIIFSDMINSPGTYEVYADIDTSAVDSSTITLDVNLIASSQTAGYMLMIDSVGQTMSISNPPNPGSGTGGPCIMTVSEHPTSPYLYKGNKVCLTAFKVQASNCSLNLNSLQLEIFGGALCTDMVNLEVIQNANGSVVGSQGVMSFNQTIPLTATVAANQTDTFFIYGHLSPNALSDITRTYEPKITLLATDSLGNPKTAVLTMATKWVKDGPTQISGVNEDASMVTLHPNPATDYIIISGYEGTVRIMDMAGIVLQEISVSEKIEIDVSKFAPGVYFLGLKNQVVKFHKD